MVAQLVMVDASAKAIVDTLADRFVTKTRNASGPPPKTLVWSRRLSSQVQKSKLVNILVCWIDVSMMSFSGCVIVLLLCSFVFDRDVSLQF